MDCSSVAWIAAVLLAGLGCDDMDCSSVASWAGQ